MSSHPHKCSIFAHMASIASVGLGQRIRKARDRAGLTQAELAGAIQLDRSVVAKIETGARRVSALELARVAEALGERIEWFVEDAPPAIVSRRNLHEAGAPSPAIDKLVERIARSVEFLAAHDPQLRLMAPPPLERPRSNKGVEEVAAEARARLGVDDSAPLLNLSTHAASAGLLVFSIDLGDGAADGASILLTRGGVAVINGHLHVGRRRLTLAHELGHYFFADEFVVDWRVDEAEGSDRWEARVDRFARALLLPASGLKQAWEGQRHAGDDLRTAAVRVASEFRVDMSTLARRLAELALVTRAEAERVRRVRTTKADIVELELLVPHEFDPPELARAYVESVLRLYRNETITDARATDLLLDTWEESDLPELPNLPESAIWKFVS